MDLWNKAAKSLEAQCKQNLNFQQDDKQAVLASLLQQIQEKKELCLKKRLKYKRRNGESVVLYDVFGKIAKWVNKFKEVGDIVMQYDTGHAALPWAAIRFLLQVSVNDLDINGGLVEGLEVISKDISRYAVIESLYLHMPSSVGKLLEDSILATYGSILYFLSRCRKHFDRTFSQRLGKSVTQTPEVFVKKHLDRIDKNDREVLKLISLADGERIKSSLSQQSVIDSKIDDLDDDFQNLQLKTSESASKLRNLLASFEDPILRTMETVTAISDMLIETKTQSESKQERLEILQWLSSVQYKKHHQGLAKSLLKGTGSWLLKKPQFIEWSASSVSSVLWLHGIPGSGKTCLVSIVIQKLLSDVEGIPDAAPIAYFYCQRNAAEPERSEPVEVLRAILKQVMCCRQGWQQESSAASEYRRRKKEAEEDGCAVERLDIREATDQLIANIANMPVTILIDALDECRSDQRHELLEALDLLVQKSANLVKIFISSRDDIDLVLRLQESPNIHISVSDNTDDIQQFVDFGIQKALNDRRLLNGNVSPQLRDRVTTSLSTKAQGMFLWVSLQIQSLCDGRRIKIQEDLLDELARVPSSLADMYSTIMSDVSQIEQHGREIAESVFKWLLCTKNAKSSITIKMCSSQPLAERANLSIENILDLCCNLVIFDEKTDTFRFAHLSIQEHLERQLSYNLSEANRFVVEKLFSSRLQSDPPSFGTDQSEISRYFQQHWQYHYGSLGEDHRREVFDRYTKTWLFHGSKASEDFQSWLQSLGSSKRALALSGDPSEELRGFRVVLPVQSEYNLTNFSAYFHDVSSLDIDYEFPTPRLDRYRRADRYRWVDRPKLCIGNPIDLGCYRNWPEIFEYYEINGYLDTSGNIIVASTIRFGKAEFVRWLYARNIRPMIWHLTLAFLCQNQEIITAIFDCSNFLSEKSLIGDQPALLLAARWGLVDVVRYLIGNGADIDCKNSFNRTPLFYAVLTGAPNSLLICMLQAGADPGAVDDDGDTPFSISIKRNGTNAARLLFETEWFAGHTFSDRRQYLILALELGCYDIACLLLFYATDPFLPNGTISDQWIAILDAIENLVPLQDTAPWLSSLLSIGSGSLKIDVSMLKEILSNELISQTLLGLAALLRRDGLFQMLIDNGIDPTGSALWSVDKEESKPRQIHDLEDESKPLNMTASNRFNLGLRSGLLARAAHMGHLERVKSILSRDIDPNVKDRKGQTALFLAVQRLEDHTSQVLEIAKEKIVLLLLENGAVANLTDSSGRSVLAYALQARYYGMSKILIEAGAAAKVENLDPTAKAFWLAFEQGEVGIRRNLLTRVRRVPLDQSPAQTLSDDDQSSGDTMGMAARLILGGAMRFLGDAV